VRLSFASSTRSRISFLRLLCLFAANHLLACSILSVAVTAAVGDDPVSSKAAAPKPKRVLLIGQGPDGHPFASHEYMAGLNILAACLQQQPGLQPVIVNADGAWAEGPELLDGADAVVLYLAEGAKWMQRDEARFAAFQQLARRGGGVVVLHWAMGTKDAAHIDGFLAIAGGCHGGPDRKYKVLTATLAAASPQHPIMAGVAPVEVHDEFYYALKFARPAGQVVPVAQAEVDGQPQTVAWAWQRPDGGRSAGFSGAHFHRNWELESYRRLTVQAVLWSLGQAVPAGGAPVTVSTGLLKLLPRE
jgi:type 1 glutamine amidotransferase